MVLVTLYDPFLKGGFLLVALGSFFGVLSSLQVCYVFEGGFTCLLSATFSATSSGEKDVQGSSCEDGSGMGHVLFVCVSIAYVVQMPNSCLLREPRMNL